MKYSSDDGATWTTVTIPDGNYNVSGDESINSYLQSVLFANNQYSIVDNVTTYPINIIGNLNTLRCDISLSAHYQLDLTASDIYSILGFASKIVTTSESGYTNADIWSGTTNLVIHCNLVGDTWNNNMPSTTLYTFIPDVDAGSLISITPYERIYVPVSTSTIKEIHIWITDQKGRVIDLNKEPINITIHLKPFAKLNDN